MALSCEVYRCYAMVSPRDIRDAAAKMERFFHETGIPLPAVRVRGHAAGLPPGGYVLRLHEVPMARLTG